MSTRRRLSDDAWLEPYGPALQRRAARVRETEARIAGPLPLEDFAAGHEYYGLHRRRGKWVLREWAPHATALHLFGSFSDWQVRDALALRRINAKGDWELVLPGDTLHHGDLYRLRVSWPGGQGDRIPPHARRVVQDPQSLDFNAQVWRPARPHRWRHPDPPAPVDLLIYEAHAGMAQETESVGTWNAFRQTILPRVVDAGYNTLQLMAVMEHPYYGSFGYHVSSLFAASSRFGTPEELKELVDAAHGLGLRVIMDLVHSHAVRNEVEGLARFDGTPYQFFHAGERGEHRLWDSLCFDYSKPEVLHFLLSNCRYWIDEFHMDGFRFDGVTSMLYRHHGLGTAFVHYDQYFGADVDEEALAYLALANRLIHRVKPSAITVAEDMSGMPGLGASAEEGGCGFDYRLAMGVPDLWFKLVRETRDEDWSMGHLWRELTNRRADEHTVSYVESHDQAIVGSKTLAFELMDAAMYHHMRRSDTNLAIDRGMALHKMIRLITLATAGHGYLTFIGNEFGHPEWIDFPREGNGWSYHFARRRWSLRDDPNLRYGQLADFDRAMLGLARDHALVGRDAPEQLWVDEGARILVFRRGDLYFFFNFHGDTSRPDYAVPAPDGAYRLVLDSDAAAFGGHARVAESQVSFALPRGEGGHMLRVYLPSRTALVFARQARG